MRVLKSRWNSAYAFNLLIGCKFSDCLLLARLCCFSYFLAISNISMNLYFICQISLYLLLFHPYRIFFCQFKGYSKPRAFFATFRNFQLFPKFRWIIYFAATFHSSLFVIFSLQFYFSCHLPYFPVTCHILLKPLAFPANDC